MSWAEDFPHIPIWLRCTQRYIIDPTIRGSIWGSCRSWEDPKFSVIQIQNIMSSTKTQAVLAKQYKVSQSTISYIKNKGLYKDVQQHI
jgi:hypothetical protein